MTYQIKCNGVTMCYMDDRKAAINTLSGLQCRAIKQGMGARLRGVVDGSIEYILTISNGMTYEMRLA